ncbi:MAG: DUF721 domain-containing protein [Saprospiraceae bacterium]
MLKHNDRILKDVLKDMIGSNKKVAKGYNTVRIKDAWKSEMGDMINSYTEKLWYRNGVLNVNLTSAPLRNELSMSKEKVIKIINDACKEALVTEVVFR